MFLNVARCDNRRYKRIKKVDVFDLNNFVAIKTFVCNEIDCFVIAFVQISRIFHSMSDYKVVLQREAFHAMSSKWCFKFLINDVTKTRRDSTLTSLLCWLNSIDFKRWFEFEIVMSNRFLRERFWSIDEFREFDVSFFFVSKIRTICRSQFSIARQSRKFAQNKCSKFL